MHKDETLAEEFARLTNEYHTGDDHTKPEAWNLLADFAVDNAAAITAALSVEQMQPGVGVKKLEFNDDPCPAAVCAFGHYVINPIYSHVELLIGYGRMSMTSLGRVQLNHGATIDDLINAAQADYEQRIRSALVDVPAVEQEPVGEAGAMPGSNGGFTMAALKAVDVPIGTKLYAHPPRSTLVPASVEGEWMPIETAPKDGDWFLACQDGEVYPCQWHEEQPDEGPGYIGWYDLFNRSFEEPTEWHPLPALSRKPSDSQTVGDGSTLSASGGE